jgi:hypothetical protein
MSAQVVFCGDVLNANRMKSTLVELCEAQLNSSTHGRRTRNRHQGHAAGGRADFSVRARPRRLEVPAWVNLTAAIVVVFFFVGAILSYVYHGARRDTVNQLENPNRGTGISMALLIAGEIGGFGVLLAGFVVKQLVWSG